MSHNVSKERQIKSVLSQVSQAARRWYFTSDKLENTPSVKDGVGGKENSYRQQAANFIQDMGQRLKV